jgi:glycosyltransferase involved in cell wall biosynthesis
MDKKKIKVVWLCHFTNAEVQSRIKPSKQIGEFAPWIPMSKRIFEEFSGCELHIISPHEYLRGIKKYNEKGIYYYFYNAHMPFTGRHWPALFKWDYITNFRKNKRVTKKLVKKIKPDIIHLHGAENAYYSSTFLQFIDKYPCILTLQGFISKSSSPKTKQITKRIETEVDILKRNKNVFYRTKTMANDIKAFNPAINMYWNTYPKKEIAPIPNVSKKWDLVFFARISIDKGIEDLLKAVSFIKRKKNDISLCVIGSGHIEPYKLLASNLGISENITWAGFLPTQDDVHQLASQARISVLPTYHDIISGTILESMFLKIPVVAYNVGSIHEVNEKGVIISLVEKKDVEGLANAILNLLIDEKLQKDRAEKGYWRAYEMFAHSDENIRDSLVNAYHKVIEDFNKRE